MKLMTTGLDCVYVDQSHHHRMFYWIALNQTISGMVELHVVV
jgi:hypothetical protein